MFEEVNGYYTIKIFVIERYWILVEVRSDDEFFDW